MKPQMMILTPRLRAEARIARRKFMYGESGKMVGESHPKAVLTDHEVNLMLELREEGKTYSWLAGKFEISVDSVRSICRGRTRAVIVTRVVTEREEVDVNPERVAQPKGFVDGTVVGTKDLRRMMFNDASNAELKNSTGSPLVSFRELADDLGISVERLRAAAASVHPPKWVNKQSSRHADNTYYRRDEIDAWVQALRLKFPGFPETVTEKA